MSQSPFQKFVNPKKNSVVKEEFRQDKKKAKKERAAYFEKVKTEKYAERQAARATRNEPLKKGQAKNKKNAAPSPVKKEAVTQSGKTT